MKKTVKIKFLPGMEGGNKISAIKAYRTATGAGLKDAKFIMDMVQERGSAEVEVTKSEREELERRGFEFDSAELRQQLRELIITAVHENTQVAEDLLGIYNKNF